MRDAVRVMVGEELGNQPAARHRHLRRAAAARTTNTVDDRDGEAEDDGGIAGRES